MKVGPSSTILTIHNEVYVMTIMVNGGHFEKWPPHLPQGKSGMPPYPKMFRIY